MKHKCSATVWEPRVSSHPCQITARVQRDGKWYCWIHDPERAQRQQDKSQLKYAVEMQWLMVKDAYWRLGEHVMQLHQAGEPITWERLTQFTKRVWHEKQKLARLRKQLASVRV